MLKYIDDLLNKTTMYRLMLHYLRFLIVVAVILSVLKILPYHWLIIFLTAGYLVTICYLFNRFFAASVGTKPNYESPIITALILTLIIGPFAASPTLSDFAFATLAGFLAMAAKYVLVIKKRHIFNPAAIGILGTFLIMGQGASWWVGNPYLLPAVIIGGLLVAYKIRRFQLIGSFLITYLVLISVSQALRASIDFFGLFRNLLLFSPLLFFALVMLPEPLTAPQDKNQRILYGAVVAIFLFAFQNYVHVPYTMELSLLTANVFARIISPNLRLTLRLIKKENPTDNIYNFWFEPIRRFAYTPGQFLEYTLPHLHSDSRGTRRFFTIAASPSEEKILLATRMASQSGSSFKEALKNLREGDEIIVSGLEGNFVLPKHPGKKIVFLAGGIGITPFRAIIKYMVDQKLRRDIVLLYSNRTTEDVAFQDIFEKARDLGVRTVYVLTEKEKVPPGWNGKVGFIDSEMIKEEVPDWQERMFFISGPEPMVMAFEKLLYGMGLPKKQVKRDYFPGYTDAHQPS